MQADTSPNTASCSVVSTLLDLQEHGKFDERTLNWVDNLEIIHPKASNSSRKRRWGGEETARNSEPKRLERKRIHTSKGKANYVAVSYTCQPGSNECRTHDAYLVPSREQYGKWERSKVRDQVFDRAIAYFNYRKVRKNSLQGFWIDQECINQVDEAEKQRAIQSMEEVYIRSTFPVALLSNRIESESQLNDLICILEYVPLEEMEESRIPGVLNLLYHITSDMWWTRGWTFQEDYCASVRMRLLIPHSPSLEYSKKRNHKLLGKLKGELCISSAEFRSGATKFCIDYQKNQGFDTDDTMCKKIIDRAGKYTEQLKELDDEGMPTITQSMSPTIFSNVGKRDITIESDRLAVIANCLNYPVRLDTKMVERRRSSLSIAMLALFLLNGEILMNSSGNTEENIFDYLRNQSLRVQTPNIDHQLTFIKHCRFPFLELSEEGILTRGHLWRLGAVVDDPRKTPPPPRGPKYHLNGYQRMRLFQLAEHLGSGDCGKPYEEIANHIDEYLNEDSECRSENITFNRWYKGLMADEIVKAMDRMGSQRYRSLRLGCLISDKSKSSNCPYRGVFISETGHQWTNKKSYVFTTVYPAEKSEDGHNKHVSLEVELQGSLEESPKRLIIKRWINGLFFFDRSSPSTNVVFPWPTWPESLKREIS